MWRAFGVREIERERARFERAKERERERRNIEKHTYAYLGGLLVDPSRLDIFIRRMQATRHRPPITDRRPHSS